MEIEQIYKNVDGIILNNLMINDDAMKFTQSIGYNGFKRFHRVSAKKLLCLHQKLANCFYDKYQMILNTNVNVTSYSAVDLKSHLQNWKVLLNNSIQELGELNQEHFDVIGVTNDIIEDLICMFLHDYEKVNRWLKRFDESMWNSIDCHLVDDKLHQKMKSIEEGE